MKANIYYVSFDRTDRFERDDASMGKLLPRDKFERVAEVELPSCFSPRADMPAGDVRIQICEIMFRHFNGVSVNNIGTVTRLKDKLRSMSVGDVITFEGEPGIYFCDQVGFTPIEGQMEASA